MAGEAPAPGMANGMSNRNQHATGAIAARVEPLQLADGARLGVATLAWTSAGAKTVEVRVDAPDGPLLCRGGSSGSAATGAWVRDGMVFFLQDVSGGNQLPAGHTLATVTATLQVAWRGVAIKDAIGAIVQEHLGLVPDNVTLLPTHHESLVCEVRRGEHSIFFKTFISGKDDTIPVEAWAYGRVRQLGVPAPDVLRLDSSGRLFPATYLLLAKVPGEPLSKICSPMADTAQALLRQAGMYLRRIHDARVDGGGRIDASAYQREGVIRGAHATWQDALLRTFSTGLQRLAATGCLDSATLRAIQATFERRAKIVARFGDCNCLLHGDFDSAQVFVDAASATVTGFFDFDDVASGDPAWDLASLAHRDGDRRLAALLKGYEPDESLATRLLDTLPLYSLIQDTIDTAVFHHRGLREQGEQAQARLRLACEQT